jgi:hypothetical protein
MRVVRALAWLPLLLAAWPVAGRAVVPCPGPVSGPTAYCPDCIYDTYGESDPDKTLDDFACAQFSDLRPLGGNPNSDQYADPFLVEGGSHPLEGVMIRLRKVGIVPGDVVVRVWDDFDVLGNDDPEDLGSFTDNRPGTVLARAAIPQASMLCSGQTVHQGSRCDVSASFDETPTLQDGVVYWVGAAMAGALTSVSWVQTAGETQQQPVCQGLSCSEEWVFANTNAEAPAWNAATNVDPVGLVRLVPEPSAGQLRAGAIGTLVALAAVRGRRRPAGVAAAG